MIDLVNKAIQNLFHAWLVAESIFLCFCVCIFLSVSISLSLSLFLSHDPNWLSNPPLSFFFPYHATVLDLPTRSFEHVWKHSRHASFSDLTAFRSARRYVNRENIYIPIDLYRLREEESRPMIIWTMIFRIISLENRTSFDYRAWYG